MHSVFWRIFASFWLAVILVAGFSVLMVKIFNQDAWILRQYPAVKNLAQQWTSIYEKEGINSAKAFLLERKEVEREKSNHINIQVLTESGNVLLNNTSSMGYVHSPKIKQHNRSPSLWRQLTEEYTSPQTGNTYLFIYRIPKLELAKWNRTNLWLPMGALIITLIVLTIFSLFLTLSITQPLNRLKGAVKALGRTTYQKNSLANLASRRDEFGLLAKDFSLMGEHLQTLIDSQRQLLRDVSHELRSPLTRLKVTLALLERASEEEREKLTNRLSLESDRLEALIAEILTLSRLDSVSANKTAILLLPLLQKLQEDAKINAPQQKIILAVAPDIVVNGWQDQLERALDNLIRNASRFNPTDRPIEITAWQQEQHIHISIRDYGVGVSAQYLAELGKPFFRVPEQTTQGYGLGLAISRRAIENHKGKLLLNNHPEGGFIAELILMSNRKSDEADILLSST